MTDLPQTDCKETEQRAAEAEIFYIQYFKIVTVFSHTCPGRSKYL